MFRKNCKMFLDEKLVEIQGAKRQKDGMALLALKSRIVSWLNRRIGFLIKILRDVRVVFLDEMFYRKVLKNHIDLLISREIKIKWT